MSPEQLMDYRNIHGDAAYFNDSNHGVIAEALRSLDRLIDYTEHREAQRAKTARRLRDLRIKTTNRCSGSARS